MALTVNDLLLAPDRQAQLTAALATAGDGAPLETLISEAEALVSQAITGYSVATAVQNGWARTLALYQAHVAAEVSVPADLKAAYDRTMDTLEAIAEGRMDNLPRSPSDSGAWGSKTQIAMVTDGAS